MKEGTELKKVSGRLVLLFFKRVIKEANDSTVPSTGHPEPLHFPCSGHDSTAEFHPGWPAWSSGISHCHTMTADHIL